jgi:mono/diheme cytochrome c family protein
MGVCPTGAVIGGTRAGLLVRLRMIWLAVWMLAGIPAVADEAPQPESGASVFQHYCSHCHGFNMVTPGTIAPDLRRFPHDARERFVNTVTLGRNNRMPPWRDILTQTQIDALWDYVRTGGKP